MATVAAMAVMCAGRAAEQAALRGWLDESLAGSSRVVLLSGEPGIGKTHLAAAVADIARERGVTVAWGRSTEQSGAPPFWPWRQVLDALLGPPVLDHDAGTDPQAERFTRFEAVRAWLVGRSATEGLVIVLDDAHWADEPSLQLLTHVAGTLEGSRILLVVTHRSTPADHGPGLVPALTGLGRLLSTRHLELGPLDRDAIATMLGASVPDELVERVEATTAGNALFVTELARHLDAGNDEQAVPATVRAAIRARLRARSAPCVEVLQTAAVAGRAFAAGLVATALDRSALACLDAIDEAVAAGLVEPFGPPGWFRFVHAVVADAVAATLGASELPLAHRRIAEAIEAYEGAGDDHLAELARHWDAAAVLGERAVAAEWCERAAAAADRRLAWEEAARLYDRSVVIGGTEVAPEDKHRRLLGAARARLTCDHVAAAAERCLEAGAIARRLDRPDLLAEAALVVEARSGAPATLSALLGLADEALAALGPGDEVLRARLLGQAAVLSFYVEPGRLDELSAQAIEAADAVDDPLAAVAASRGRHLTCAGAEGVDERLELAGRIGDAGRQLGRSSVVQWEHIWRFDTLIELGRLPEAAAELRRLGQCVDQVGLPMSRWHVARAESMLAQATGRFAEAERSAVVAHGLFAAYEEPVGAIGMLLGMRTTLAMHTGFEQRLVDDWLSFELEAPAFLGDLPLFGPAMALAGVGAIDDAAAIYARLDPMDRWEPPPFLATHLHCIRMQLALRLGRLDDVAATAERLRPHRALHIGGGAGGVSYEGPVTLWLGTAAAAHGHLDEAVDHLREAVASTRANGARGFAVHAAVELAETLRGRAGPGDDAEAAALLTWARPEAVALGMSPWLVRADAATHPSSPEVLSARELEVAALVAQGRTNKDIAAELYLSERTAQNHVQHILTKLGFRNRAQIAAWHIERQNRPSGDRFDRP